MHVVEIDLKPSDLSKQMAAMRVWLDEQRIDVSTFACRHKEDGMLVHLEFRLAHPAAAFAAVAGNLVGKRGSSRRGRVGRGW